MLYDLGTRILYRYWYLYRQRREFVECEIIRKLKDPLICLVQLTPLLLQVFSVGQWSH